ncbi:MAG: hypothetical protein WC144_03730 [Sulfurimonas sp.]|jgi:hypothetical protein|nr:hypothetical protein [Sulfurimonadaceae bacterium]
MGWTCQYDVKGYCKLLKQPCVPGIKGCILTASEYTFSTGSYEEDKKAKESKDAKQIDWAELAKSN